VDVAASVALCKAAQRATSGLLCLPRRCLSAGAKHDLVVFRLTQLWFSLGPDDDAVNAQAAAAVDGVPSHKFLPLAYQIASRLGPAGTPYQAGRRIDIVCLNQAWTRPEQTDPSMLGRQRNNWANWYLNRQSIANFGSSPCWLVHGKDSCSAGPLCLQQLGVHSQDTLRRLLVRLGREHPYHTLYHLLALKHGNYDKHGRPGSADRTEGGMLRTVDADKVAAAGSTLAAIRADPSRSAACSLHSDR